MGIDTEQIVMAFERFVSRRGIPVVIYSNHEMQLKRASKEPFTQIYVNQSFKKNCNLLLHFLQI